MGQTAILTFNTYLDIIYLNMRVIDKVPDIRIKGKQLEILGILGAGGSKTVLDTSINGLRRALAMPNHTDPISIQDKKWESVVLEAGNARLLSGLGLLTIPDYAPEVILVKDRARPGLSMTPFSDLPFEVFDGKDGSKTWEKGPLSDIDHFSGIAERISSVKSDISILSNAGVLLNSDSLSFANMPDGTMRLFLYDLQGMLVTNHIDKLNGLSTRYAQLIINKLDNVFDFEQSQRFVAQGYNLEARRQLAGALVS